MRIIVLQGLPNRGKTSTINILHTILVDENGSQFIDRRQLGNEPNDFEEVVLWKNQRIAIYSMGDNSTTLAEAIHSYHRQNNDVMVCALSTRKPMIRANNAINKFERQRINKTVINSGIEAEEIDANTVDAQTLFNLL